MLKQKYLTCLNLQEKLSEKITGDIFITINDDTLVVHINGR